MDSERKGRPKQAESASGTTTGHPWSVPLALSDVPETGRHIELIADEPTRAAIAKLARLRDLPSLMAAFDVTSKGHSGMRVIGHVRATVGQDCVVTLEPIDNQIDEAVDLIFSPDALPSSGDEVEVPEDAPEPLVDGVVDLGALATEFLLLGIDPYPRKSGAEFQAPPADENTAHPFAALAALKKGQGGQGE